MMRSCAEILRLLALHTHFDLEAKDMTAFLVFNLRAIYETIEESAGSWDERNYWKKAEKLRHRWLWTRQTADKLEALILRDAWDEVPEVLLSLVPYFQHITIQTITRNSDWWCGALKALKRQHTSNLNLPS